MKIRHDFVSNSSSSSFIVDKSRHGCWFNQLFNIILRISQNNLSTINVVFDSNVDITKLFNCMNENISVDEFQRGFTVAKYKNKVHWQDDNDQTKDRFTDKYKFKLYSDKDAHMSAGDKLPKAKEY